MQRRPDAAKSFLTCSILIVDDDDDCSGQRSRDSRRRERVWTAPDERRAAERRDQARAMHTLGGCIVKLQLLSVCSALGRSPRLSPMNLDLATIAPNTPTATT